MVVIKFDKVNKAFKRYTNKSYSIKETFINKVLRRDKLEIEKFQVLKDATFEIEQGETIGIIGENGTGKSTTLKLLSKILYPDSGNITVNGKISSLLEIGAGFQPDLTGKENVYLYGSILGLSKQEIDNKYNEIVSFSEVGNFMETAVKNYSSGMYMRLAFAVAINVDPDILLIDEVLAVGDETFQKKCIEKILEFKKKGKTIVFVSHDMSSVKKICDRVFFVKKGGELIEGSPDEMIGLYLNYCYSKNNNAQEKETINEIQNMDITFHKAIEEEEINRWGNKGLEINKVYLTDRNNEVRNVFKTGEDIKINIGFIKNDENINTGVIGLAFYSQEGYHIGGPNCKQDGYIIKEIRSTNMINVIVKNNIFLKGRYYLTVALYDEECLVPFDHREKHYYFDIIPNEIEEYGLVRIECSWNV